MAQYTDKIPILLCHQIHLAAYLSNKLLSFTNEDTRLEEDTCKWTEQFPPMPTSQYGACALCTGKALIVAGEEGDVHIILIIASD